MSRERFCDIDDCRLRAVIVCEGYPDDVALCREHEFIERDREREGELLPWERIVKIDADSGVGGVS